MFFDMTEETLEATMAPVTADCCEVHVSKKAYLKLFLLLAETAQKARRESEATTKTLATHETKIKNL